MGSPYNQLQQLNLAYSGREIGIDKYKPYTFSNEKPEFELSYYGSLFQALLERSYSYSVAIPSGGLDGGLKENISTRFAPSGSQVAQPFDEAYMEIAPTGVQRFIPIARASLSVANTGIIGNNLADRFDYFVRVPTGLLDSAISDTSTRLNSVVKSGKLQSYPKDTAAITFVFFSGTYYSGAFTPPHVPVNYPATGVDSAFITFTMFTGTYQGS